MTKNVSEARPRASFYDVLQVSPSASLEVIHAAYRALAREYHPDVNSTAVAAQRMLELNAAHDILGDSERRARYDLRLRRARAHRSEAAFDGPASSVSMRGRPRPHSPRRVEEVRAIVTPARSVRTPVRTRIFVVLALIVVFLVAASAVVWLAQFLDDVPDSQIGLSFQAQLPEAWAAQPLLNHA